MFQQVYDPVAQSLGLSSIFAALPLLTMFIMLGGFRLSPQLSGLCSLIVAMGVAIIIYGMPVSVAANSALYGAAFSILPIILIIINAIWIHNMMVKSGYFDILRRSFGVISTDLRVQSIIIAFCFGGLLEALAGAGTPIAIAGVMMVAIGMDPLKAALCALVADTAPVAFGELGVPITTLAAVTGLPYDELGAIIGRQTPILALFIPLILVWIVDGGRGLRQTWLPALIAGFAYAVTQFVSSSWISVPLTDVLGALAGAAALVAFLQVWKPKETIECAIVSEGENSKIPFNSRSVSIAFLPYIAIIVIFTLSQIGPIAQALSAGVSKFAWPGLAITNPTGGAIGTSLSLPWLPGTATLLDAFPEGVRRCCRRDLWGNSEAAEMGHSDGSLRACRRIRHEFFRTDHHTRALARHDRTCVRIPVACHRLDRRGDYRIRQFRQRALRCSAGRGGA